MSIENKTTEILLHSIGWGYRDFEPEELPESEVEHIESLIKEGYNQGELCYYDSEIEVEYRGWWKIV